MEIALKFANGYLCLSRCIYPYAQTLPDVLCDSLEAQVAASSVGLRFPHPSTLNLIFPRYTSLWPSLLSPGRKKPPLSASTRRAFSESASGSSTSSRTGRLESSRRCSGLAVSVPADHGENVRGVDGQLPVIAGKWEFFVLEKVLQTACRHCPRAAGGCSLPSSRRSRISPSTLDRGGPFSEVKGAELLSFQGAG